MKNRTLAHRLAVVLSLLCDEAPPPELVWGWIEGDESWVDDPAEIGPPMQQWVNAHCRVTWPMSIDVLDAAETIAGSIRDGEDEHEQPVQPARW